MLVGICKLEDFSVGFLECHLTCLVLAPNNSAVAEAELNKKPQYHTVTERYPSLGYKTREEERALLVCIWRKKFSWNGWALGPS